MRLSTCFLLPIPLFFLSSWILFRRKKPLPSATEKQSISDPKEKYNLLIITADQLRHDVLGYRQAELSIYDNKLKVRTPNIDKLAGQGVVFTDAYAQMSLCAPARATLRSGCTVDRHGVIGNTALVNYQDNERLKRKIDTTRTYDQILYHVGYQVTSMGKFHIPDRWFFDVNGTGEAIRYDSYSIDFKYPYFAETKCGANDDQCTYDDQVRAWMKGKSQLFVPGQQLNDRSGWFYNPIPLDSRFGNQVLQPDLKNNASIGLDSLGANYSLSAFTGTQGLLEVRRLSQSDKPWALTVSFTNPHPPYIVADEYASYYLSSKDQLLVPPNIHNRFSSNDHAEKQAHHWEAGFNESGKVQTWTALYYALVEEVDTWVGTILDELNKQGMADQTMVVFTSDHGEFLGGHGLQGKFGFYQEVIRVPMIMRLPGEIDAKSFIHAPVSHLDFLATVMDYLGYSDQQNSDGKSLRPLISGKSYRQDYDDEYAVSQNHKGFMVRHGSWKLIIPTLATSTNPDMLFDVVADPFEMRNLIELSGSTAAVIGKAEHLKCLLLEWMNQHDGVAGYYSQPPTDSAIHKVRSQRTWDTADFWVSDPTLELKPPVFVDGEWRSNAWLYIGRTRPGGTLNISDISLVGVGRSYFILDASSRTIAPDDYMRIKVAFKSSILVEMAALDVQVVIESNVGSRRVIPILPYVRETTNL